MAASNSTNGKAEKHFMFVGRIDAVFPYRKFALFFATK